MAGPKRLIVGLGNPGAEYDGTRHNIGFEVVDVLAKEFKISLAREGQSVAGTGSMRGRSVALAKPQTYMNRSGTAVRGLMNRFGLLPQEVLVIVDDLNLPAGAVRVRQNGSAGGHNGIQDIVDQIHSSDFPRIRIGIGNGFPRGKQSDYVLAPFTPDERPIMDEAVRVATDAAITFIVDGILVAMNRYNKR